VLLIAAGGAAVAVRESVRAERERTEAAERETERLQLEGEKQLAERDRAAAVARARERVPELLAQATDQRRRYLFDQAARTLGSAAELAKDLPDLAAEVAQARTDLALVVELDTIRDKKWVRVFRDRQLDDGGVLDHFDTESAPLAYQKALAARGYDPFGEPAAFAERVRASKVKGELVAALDDWAVYEKDSARAERLLAALRQIRPPPSRSSFSFSLARVRTLSAFSNRDAPRDAVQPADDGAAPGDSAGLPREREERGLRRVFGRVVVVQHRAARARHQPRVPEHEQLERGLVAVVRELRDQLRVGRAVRGIEARGAEVLANAGAGHRWHLCRAIQK
jgi:hypothetical protein